MPRRTPTGKTKKQNRERRPALAPRPIEADIQAAPNDSAQPKPPAPVADATTSRDSRPARSSILAGVRRPTARRNATALVTDYGYVMSDLRRIFVLAAAAIAVLVLLTLVIR